MGTYNSAVITNGGQSMIAQAVAGASLEFTTIKTSSYAYPAGTNLATLTTISGINQSKDITSATVYNSRVIKISAAVDNTGISTAYTINTIGIYAKVGSSAESLFAVVTASAADTMPAYDNKPYSYIYEINLTMQNAANVTVTVNAAGLVNVADLNAAKVEIQGEIADLKNSIGEITPMFASKNLIDTSKLTSGKYVDYTTGNILTAAAYSVTDFIPIEPNIPYTYSIPSGEFIQQMAYYDIDRNYVSGFAGSGQYGTYTFTVPNDCYYLRWTITNANVPYAQLEKGTQPTTYEAYNLELKGEHINAEETAEEIKAVMAFAPIETKNLIDLSACLVGKFVDSSNGGVGTNVNYSATDFIPVVAGDTYTFSIYGLPNEYVERYALYDENKSYVSGSLNSGVTGSYTFTIPDGCHYLRWSLVNAYKEYEQLEKGAVATEYENYRKYIPAEYMPKNVKTVGASGCDFTSLLDALKSTDSTTELHLKSGIYDIVAEYEDFYGSDFWNNYSGYSGVKDPFYKGLWLEKGRRVIGEAGAIISFPYSGNNTDVKDWFSIFANDTDVLLENLTITSNSQCCRYAIHDDFQPNGGVIEFRKLLFDMTPNKHAVIGAGLGIDTTYIIDNCVFENNSKFFDIHYHGNTVANQDTHCKFFITNCYGSKYCYFGYYGDSTEVSDAIVNNCAFQNVECSAYSGATFANIRLIQWNNTRV